MGRFATTIFSAAQRYNIVATSLRKAATLFQNLNPVLHYKSPLRIVSRNITFVAGGKLTFHTYIQSKTIQEVLHKLYFLLGQPINDLR